jgi:hypothetical protein
MVRITRVVLLLRLMVLVAALLTKHLIEKATKLGIDQSQNGKKSKDVAHFGNKKQCIGEYIKFKILTATCDAVHILIDKLMTKRKNSISRFGFEQASQLS